MPANAGIYFNCLMQVAAFEFFETDDLFYDLNYGYETEPLTTNFGTIGFDSMWFLNNMSSMGILMVLFPLIFLISPLLCCCEGNRFVSKIRSFLDRHLYWSFPLRFMIESYTIVVLCCLINFKWLQTSELWDIINSTLSIAVFIMIVAVPIIISMMLHFRKQQLS